MKGDPRALVQIYIPIRLSLDSASVVSVNTTLQSMRFSPWRNSNSDRVSRHRYQKRRKRCHSRTTLIGPFHFQTAQSKRKLHPTSRRRYIVIVRSLPDFVMPSALLSLLPALFSRPVRSVVTAKNSKGTGLQHANGEPQHIFTFIFYLPRKLYHVLL